MATTYKDKDALHKAPAQMMASNANSKPAPALDLKAGLGTKSSANEVFKVAGGFASSSARLMMLVARETDLTRQMQMMNQARLELSNSISTLMQGLANQSPDSTHMGAIQARIQALQEADRRLELQIRRIDTQQNAVQVEIEAIRRIIEQNIDASFRGMG